MVRITKKNLDFEKSCGMVNKGNIGHFTSHDKKILSTTRKKKL